MNSSIKPSVSTIQHLFIALALITAFQSNFIVGMDNNYLTPITQSEEDISELDGLKMLETFSQSPDKTDREHAQILLEYHSIKENFNKEDSHQVLLAAVHEENYDLLIKLFTYPEIFFDPESLNRAYHVAGFLHELYQHHGKTENKYGLIRDEIQKHILIKYTLKSAMAFHQEQREQSSQLYLILSGDSNKHYFSYLN